MVGNLEKLARVLCRKDPVLKAGLVSLSLLLWKSWPFLPNDYDEFSNPFFLEEVPFLDLSVKSTNLLSQNKYDCRRTSKDIFGHGQPDTTMQSF